MNQHTNSPDDDDADGSSLLAELAGEATSKLKAMQMAAEDHHSRSQRLHEALGRLFQFLKPFSRHSNDIAPEIQRAYYFDSKTIFTPLRWSDAISDFRKQSLADDALLDHVVFRVTLTAPAPVPLTRRWTQMQALKNELGICGLRTLDDLDLLFRSRGREDLFNTTLAPEFALKMRFHGNYREGKIDLACNNLKGFGISSFRLLPEDVSPAMLDDLGRYLIGRSDRLPALLDDTRRPLPNPR